MARTFLNSIAKPGIIIPTKNGFLSEYKKPLTFWWYSEYEYTLCKFCYYQDKKWESAPILTLNNFSYIIEMFNDNTIELLDEPFDPIDIQTGHSPIYLNRLIVNYQFSSNAGAVFF